MADSSLIAALHAAAPAFDLARGMHLYAFLVGRWDTRIVTHEPNGQRNEGQGEIHAGWVLEGRAIQDVWMIPPRAQRRPDTPPMPVVGNWYGTTLRVYAPELDAWHIFWIDPATQFFARQVGRSRGADIVQEGTWENGVKMRWSFTKITPQSFHWLGESSEDGERYRLQVEVIAQRSVRAESGFSFEHRPGARVGAQASSFSSKP